MLTSSTPAIWVTFNFFNAAWSFRSSPWDDAWDFLTTLRRGVPFPPVLSNRAIIERSEIIVRFGIYRAKRGIIIVERSETSIDGIGICERWRVE